jgi:hypothetical protein
MPKPEHELERVAAVLTQEARAQAERLATDLFPQGPPGHRKLSRARELEMVAYHWHDPTFRKNLLNRMAPPGPNGYPDPELAQDFIDLYTEAVLKHGSVQQDTPGTDKAPITAPQGPLPLGGTVPPPGAVPTFPQAAAPAAQAPGPLSPTTPPQMPGPTQVQQNVQPGQPGATSLPMPLSLPDGMPPPPPLPEGL